MTKSFTLSSLIFGNALIVSALSVGCGTPYVYEPPGPQYPSCTIAASASPLCTPGNSGCPLALDTVVSCPGTSEGYGVKISAAAGPVLRDYVLVRDRDGSKFRKRLYTIEGAVMSSQDDPIPDDEEVFDAEISMQSDGMGGPRIVELLDGSLIFYTPNSSGVYQADKKPGLDHRALEQTAMSANGNFLASTYDGIHLYVPGSGWSSVPLKTSFAADPVFDVDAMGRVYQGEVDIDSFQYWVGSSDPPTDVPLNSPGSFDAPRIIAPNPPSTLPVLATLTTGQAGMVLNVENTGGTYSQMYTGGYTRTCNPAPSVPNCSDARCVDQGEQAMTYGLTRANDGTLWIAYLSRTVHRDVTMVLKSFFVSWCADDKYTPRTGDGALQLVISRVEIGNPNKVVERYRAPYTPKAGQTAPIGFSSFRAIGSHLHLMFNSDRSELRRMVFDTQRL